MTYRFLPWVRRGLAAEIETADAHDGSMPVRATFPVTLAVSGAGPAVDATVALYGPGDVIGFDTRSIVRIEPKSRTIDHPPNQFVSLELDEPSLPWMFTPARASGNERLRPWLTLVVVKKQPGVSISVSGSSPLPVLTISGPADPGAELPDLDDSWAWAHAQLIDDGTPAPTQLAAQPDRNVARLVAPRRLETGTDYIAALVPAFASGRTAGLGLPPDGAPTTGPAWPTPPPAEVRLPLYYHWEFRTGPAGDFESLARRLTPIELPAGVGSRPLFIGAADPSLPTLGPDTGGIVDLEGALRSPELAAGGSLGPDHQMLVHALTSVLDAGQANLVGGTASSVVAAENVAPPIYGSWHVRTHELPTGNRAPRWLRELNADPRHRVAAGLGTAVVQANQERYMDAAWEQVGDVLAANAALELARLMQLVAARVMDRHVRPLTPQVTVGFTAPSQPRTILGTTTVDRLISASALPDRVTDAAFRRRVTPRSAVLARAARLGPAEVLAGGGIELTAISRLASATLTVDLHRRVDGLTTSALLGVTRIGGGLTAEPLDLRRSLRTPLGRGLLDAATKLGQLGPGAITSPTSIRPDLQLTGVLLDDHLVHLGPLQGRPGQSMSERLGELLVVRGRTPDPLGRVGGATIGGRRTPPVARPTATLSPPVVTTVVVADFARGLTAYLEASTATVISALPPPAPLDLAGLGAAMVAAVDPSEVIEARVRARIGILGGRRLTDVDLAPERFRQAGPVGPIMIGPQLPEPLYAALAAYDEERFLPGAARLPANAITLMATNPRFVEAFLVGANHEMNRELLWRTFPTDRRGTPFHHFWDRIDGSADIGPIHEFNGSRGLGGNSIGQVEGSLVLVLRGDLFRRYPKSIVYAAPALPNRRLDPDPSRILLPVFDGQIAPDITFSGFDLTVEDVLPAPGWFFVIQEQPSEPRFGLDEPDGPAGGAPATWAGLSWAHPGTAPGDWLALGSVPAVARRLATTGAAEATWGANAAHLAAITFQRTFRVVVHSDEVLEGTGRRP